MEDAGDERSCQWMKRKGMRHCIKSVIVVHFCDTWHVIGKINKIKIEYTENLVEVHATSL